MRDDEVIGLLREIASASCTMVRPGGWRVLRVDDVLALARVRLGAAVTEGELDAAIESIGGRRDDITNPLYALKQVLRRRSIWRGGYTVPAVLFDGLPLPTRLRAPRFRLPDRGRRGTDRL